MSTPQVHCFSNVTQWELHLKHFCSILKYDGYIEGKYICD